MRTIAAIAVGVGASFFALAVLLGIPPSDGFVFAIGVTVALVPEALLPTVTLSLAWGPSRWPSATCSSANLDAVETLGSTTFVCTDKTGTLTRNQMTVVAGWTPDRDAVTAEPGLRPDGCGRRVRPTDARRTSQRLAAAAARCSTGMRAAGRRRVAAARRSDGGGARRLRPPARARHRRRARGRGR